MMKKMAHKPADANRTFSVMRKMFNLAGYGAIVLTQHQPATAIMPMYPNGKATHLIGDEEMGRVNCYLDQLEAEGLEHAVIPLAHPPAISGLPLAFLKIVSLQWDWIDLENRRVVWPDSRERAVCPSP